MATDKKSLAALYDISHVSERNKSPIEPEAVIEQAAIDEIKDDFNTNYYTLPFYIESDRTNYDLLYLEEMKYFYIRQQNAHELTPFYTQNIKTAYISTLLETLIDGIFDGADIEKVTNEHLDLEEIEKMAEYLLIHGRCIVVRKNDIVSVLPPYRYYHEESTGKYVIYHYAHNNQPLREEILNNLSYTYHDSRLINPESPVEAEVFEMTCPQIITDGLLEIAMLRSSLYTLLQSDLWGGSTITFIDEQYTDNNGKLNGSRVAYIPTQTIKNVNPDGAGIKPLFEQLTPEIRSSELQSILEVIDATAANLIGMSSDIFGSGNATESQLLSAKTAKRFNKLKMIFQLEINNAFEHLNISNKITLERYRADSDEVLIRNAVLVAGSNIGTIKPLLERLYPHLTQEELDTIYLKGEIKANRPLTDDEKELAITLGLQSEDPPEDTTPQEGVTEVSDPMTTDSEIAASELTPTQGVANQEGE